MPSRLSFVSLACPWRLDCQLSRSEVYSLAKSTSLLRTHRAFLTQRFERVRLSERSASIFASDTRHVSSSARPKSLLWKRPSSRPCCNYLVAASSGRRGVHHVTQGLVSERPHGAMDRSARPVIAQACFSVRADPLGAATTTAAQTSTTSTTAPTMISFTNAPLLPL